MQYITMCLVLINYNTGTSGTTVFIVYICGLHVSTHTQVIFRPSCICESIKSYARWDPIALTSLKHINYIQCLCLSIKVKIRIAVFSLRWCGIRYGDLSYVGAYIALLLCTSWYSPLGFGMYVLLINVVVPEVPVL